MTAVTTMEIIGRRVSCRNYSDRPLEGDVLAEVREQLRRRRVGPFGAGVRFELLDFSGGGNRSNSRLGTYGFIHNAAWYIAGAARRGEWAGCDYGYCLEQIVLHLTAMGLGTCWMSGTFSRSVVNTRMALTPDETVPAVTPVGYPAEGETLLGRIIKRAVRAQTRKPWPELFWDRPTGLPLTQAAAGVYRDPLEAVRLAPSGVNLQPWRVAVDLAGRTCGFYSKSGPSIDLGIAMCHFEMVAREQGLSGQWLRLDVSRRSPISAGLVYVANWVGDDEVA